MSTNRAIEQLWRIVEHEPQFSSAHLGLWGAFAAAEQVRRRARRGASLFHEREGFRDLRGSGRRLPRRRVPARDAAWGPRSR